MPTTIQNQQFDGERALYALRDAELSGCLFEGDADGESALKECRGIKAHNCKFALRYPLWHAEDFLLTDCTLTESARAPMWYTSLGTVRHCRIDAPKVLRESTDTLIDSSVIHSSEFGWKCNGLRVRSSLIESDYLFFESKDLEISKLHMKGKYSFQYVENGTLEDSILDTKDAFWHAKNLCVRGCRIQSEYLGWYSENLTLIDCHIVGTQPLCYCKGLRLIGCTVEGADLAFEYSDVHAEIRGRIDSVKNPRSGLIRADEIGEIIRENSVMDTDCRIELITSNT